MFNSSESKSVDPAIWSDPFGWDFSGVELSIRWCNVLGTCKSGKKARRRAQQAAAAAAAAAQAAERQRQQQLEQQRQAQAAQAARQAQARAAALAAQRQAEAAALATKRIGAATQAQQDIVAQREQSASQQFIQDIGAAGAEERLGATVGQPGISRTQLTASTTPLGGYSGTSPGDISPTALNI
jgi:hypothetical protein